jgi:hypothetical protein
MKEYTLKPTMTMTTLNPTPTFDKPAVVRTAQPAATTTTTTTAPALPPRQPLPTAVIDPAKPMLKLAQKDHASPKAPRQFARDQLVTQVKQWVAEGFQIFSVQESCGFGAIAMNWRPSAFPVRPSNANAKARGDGSFWSADPDCWAIAATARWRSINT